MNALSANTFLHHEHHRFPAVPTRRLSLQGARLDQAEGGRSLRLLNPVASGRV